MARTVFVAIILSLVIAAAALPVDDANASQQSAPATPNAPAGTKGAAAPSPEQLGEVLRQAFEMVQAAAAQPLGFDPPPGVPGALMMVPGLPKETQADAMRQIGRARARAGDLAGARAAWQSALDAAAEITYNPAGRTATLLAVARAQLEAGDRDEARFTLRQALQSARSSAAALAMMAPGVVAPPLAGNPMTKKVDLLRQIAQAQLEAGDAEAARDALRQADAIARSIARPLDRIGALLKLTGADGELAAMGRSAWSGALDAALAEKGDYARSRAVELVLRARIRAGQLVEALATIADRLDGDLKDYAIWVVADAIAASDRSISPQAMARLRELASKGRYDRPAKKIKVYRRLAEAHARAGDYDQAYRCLGEIQPANNVENFRTIQGRVYLMKAVAEAQLKAGQSEAAKDTVLAALEAIAPLPDGDAEAYFPMADLARILARAGDLAGAMRTAGSLARAESRVKVLGEIAAVQARQGRREEARATVGRAIEAAGRAPNEALWSLDPTLSNLPRAPIGDMDPMLPVQALIAQAQARADDLDGALRTISGMGSSMWTSYYRDEAVGQIIGARLEVGDIDGAHRAAEMLPNPHLGAPMIVPPGDHDFGPFENLYQRSRAGLLERVARTQAERGDPAAVLDWARTQEPTTRLGMLRGLAEGLAERLDPKRRPAGPANQFRPGP